MTQRKESETIIELKTDVSWIKENLKDISAKVSIMHETFMEGSGKINSLNRRVYGGDGSIGLIEKTELIESYLDKVKGGLTLMKILLGFSGVTLVGVLLFIIKVASEL